MRAVVLQGPGGVDALEVQSLPLPVPADGWVLIRVRAAGLNRSELHTRLGLAEGVTFPRVPVIDARHEIRPKVPTCTNGAAVTLRQLRRGRWRR